MKQTLLSLLLWGLTLPVYANLLPIDPRVPVLADPPARYVVQGGEQWADILSYFVTDPHFLLQTWEDPLPVLPTGAVVSLVPQGNQLFIQVKRGRNVKLEPRVRIIQEAREPPVIPVEAIQQFLNRPSVLTEEEKELAGYVIANSSKTLLATVGDEIYVRGLDFSYNEDQFMLARPGQTFTNQAGDEVYAHEAIYLGDAELVTWDDDLATLVLTNVTREILNGDLVMPLTARTFRENFEPRAPAFSIVGEDAHIVAVVDGVSKIGQYQVVVVNRGLNDGLEVGHVLQVMQRGGTVVDRFGDTQETVTLPNQQAGTLMVFKTFDAVSYALVMSASRSIDVFDFVVAP